MTPSIQQPGPPRIGLVLGGGGMTGMAFHAGVLEAIERHLGLDLAAVELIVGTSAGALVGSLLRAGARPADLAAWCCDGPLPSPWSGLRAAVQQEWDRTMTRPWRIPLRMPWDIGRDIVAGSDWRAALLAAFPYSGADHRACVRPFAADHPTWPERRTWICAVERPSGTRVVFGRDRAVPLEAALAASSAVPGLFSTVTIDGRRYCDGGVRSMTNLDLVAGEDLDAVIVSSPLSLSAPPALSDALPPTALRRILHRQVSGESAQVLRSGTPVLVVEPDWRAAEALGHDAMSQHRLSDVVEAARLAAERMLGASPPSAHFAAALEPGRRTVSRCRPRR